MASAASPSTTDPKMAELCNHTAHASSHYACTEDGNFKCPILPNIDGDIQSDSGWFFVGLGEYKPVHSGSNMNIRSDMYPRLK